MVAAVALRSLKQWWFFIFVAALVRKQLREGVNNMLRSRDKFDALLAGMAVVFGRKAWRMLRRAQEETGLLDMAKQLGFAVVQLVPQLRAKADKEMESMMAGMEKEIHDGVVGQRIEALPDQGMDRAKLSELLKSRAKTDEKIWNTGKHSGTVYISADDRKELSTLQSEAAGFFATGNPLHFDAYPMLRQMEAEIVAMTLKLVNGGPGGCGCTTYGGTESILLAIKAMRDRAAARGVTEPNLIIPTSAHAAFDKAGQYFQILIRKAPILENGEVDMRAVRRNIDSNTIGLAGSAPNFPQGTIDPIPELGQLALKHDIPLHVDCCLGSYMVVYLEAIGKPTLHKFDFRVPGVTSMSMDTHKYGQTTKGSSVLMYASEELMHFQYAAVPKWSGGVYITPTLMGSRTGSGIAAAWATMLYFGSDKYREFARVIHEAKEELVAGVDKIPGIKVQGRPDAMVVAFESTSKDLNIYAVGSALSKLGDWHLNSLQSPPGIHMALTLANCGMVPELLADMARAVEQAKTSPSKGGAVALYGMSAVAPVHLLENAACGVMDLCFKTRPTRSDPTDKEDSGSASTKESA
jgi:sphinganine-1-phosphate aldolase